MMVKFWGSALLLSICSIGFAQQDSSYRKVDHYVGVQANQLVRQIFNLSNSNAVVNNPYLLVYSFNNKKTRWGLNVGFGYTFNQIKDGDAVSARETKINNYFFRVGFEKKTNIGKKWILSSGIDIINDNQTNKTNNTSNGSSFKTETKSKGWGLGPRATLNFKITDRIIIGTECTYYFRTGKNSQETSSFGFSEKISDNSSQFLFTAPAVLLLIMKF